MKTNVTVRESHHVPPAQTPGAEHPKESIWNRAQRRGAGLRSKRGAAHPVSIHTILARGPFSRIRSGIRTGQPAHFKRWMAEASMKRALQNARTSWVTDRSEQAKVKDAFSKVAEDYPTLWDLAHANRRHLLALPGVGPATLKVIHLYLTGNKVQPDWKP